jgi:hypothetical protein
MSRGWKRNCWTLTGPKLPTPFPWDISLFKKKILEHVFNQEKAAMISKEGEGIQKKKLLFFVQGANVHFLGGEHPSTKSILQQKTVLMHSRSLSVLAVLCTQFLLWSSLLAGGAVCWWSIRASS